MRISREQVDQFLARYAATLTDLTRVVVPVRQAGEAQLVDGLDLLGVGSLGQLVAVLRGDPVPDIEPIEVVG
jgi:magnesium chelatase family protein